MQWRFRTDVLERDRQGGFGHYRCWDFPGENLAENAVRHADTLQRTRACWEASLESVANPAEHSARTVGDQRFDVLLVARFCQRFDENSLLVVQIGGGLDHDLDR